jgi:hypothetical protein
LIVYWKSEVETQAFPWGMHVTAWLPVKSLLEFLLPTTSILLTPIQAEAMHTW